MRWTRKRASGLALFSKKRKFQIIHKHLNFNKMKKLVSIIFVVLAMSPLFSERIFTGNAFGWNVFRPDYKTIYFLTDTLYLGDTVNIGIRLTQNDPNWVYTNSPSDSVGFIQQYSYNTNGYPKPIAYYRVDQMKTQYELTKGAVGKPKDSVMMARLVLNSTDRRDRTIVFLVFTSSLTRTYEFPYKNTKRTNVTALTDATIGNEETVIQYIDLNGRATESPKGLVIAVYSDGRRRKVVVD